MIYGILLAAGHSKRMGRPKQLLPWRGQPLVRFMAETALASRLAGLVVVLGAEAARCEAALSGLDGPIETVECPDCATGQAASLRCGLAHLPTTAPAAVVLLVDQPFMTAALIDQLLTAFEANPNVLAVVPRYNGRRGNPVLLVAGLFDELRTLEGDTGARGVLERHAAQVHWLDVNDPAVVIDVDTPEAYRQSAREGAGEGSALPAKTL